MRIVSSTNRLSSGEIVHIQAIAEYIKAERWEYRRFMEVSCHGSDLLCVIYCRSGRTFVLRGELAANSLTLFEWRYHPVNEFKRKLISIALTDDILPRIKTALIDFEMSTIDGPLERRLRRLGLPLRLCLRPRWLRRFGIRA
jgi:hypothetical protein